MPDSTLEQTAWSFCEWLNGDAMNLVNDEGERFSAEPYFAAIEQMGKLAPPTRLRSLSGMIYRGVGFQNDPSVLQPGKIVTSKKRYQSWTPDYKTAVGFATNYGGVYGVVFAAKVDQNRKSLVVSVHDVYNYVKSLGVNEDWAEQLLYDLSRYAEQDEIIIRGTMVAVDAVKIVKKPRNR